jgi:hypothetical protein
VCLGPGTCDTRHLASSSCCAPRQNQDGPVGREGAGGRAGGREDEGGAERGRKGRGEGERERGEGGGGGEGEEVCGGHGVCIATQRDFRNVSAVVAEHRAGGIVGAHECGRGVCVCDVWYEGEWCETHLHTQGMPLILGLFCSFMGLFLGLF